MPLLNRKDFLDIVNAEDGRNGKVGLLIFQAVMFSGSAVRFQEPQKFLAPFC
jgi:hypothetical protein